MKQLMFIILFISSVLVYGKPITVGILLIPPFASPAGNDKDYFGFSIDLMDKLCVHMNTDCVYKPIPLNTELALLQKGTIDLAFTQIPITLDSGAFQFSLPYLISDGQFLTMSNSPINKLADINNKRIGMLTEALYQGLQNTFYKNNKIKRYSSFPNLITGLENNEVDVILVNNHVAQYMINNSISNIKLIGRKISIGEGYGLLALKKNERLIKKVNSALLRMEADGSYISIYDLYFSD